jgi:hypothetical protein
MERSEVSCTSHQDGVSGGIIVVPFDQISSMDEKAMNIICSSDGIITSAPLDFDTANFYDRMKEAFCKNPVSRF